MGQAFRRASGRIRSSSAVDTASSKSNTTIDRRPPSKPKGPIATDSVEISQQISARDAADVEGAPRVNADNVLEEKDPSYDAMLSQMVGRIKSKPGGKLEMGEAFVVERYNRPMPKLRNTNVDSSRYEERPAPAGTLNVAQMHQIIRLYEGKAEDHNGRVDVNQIAATFGVDASKILMILQYLSLPPEDSAKEKKR